MIRHLKVFLEWLDKRYPPKVHVTDESFTALLRQDTERSQRLSSLLIVIEKQESRIVFLEKSVDAIKDALAKGSAPSIAPERRRAEFIASGRMAE